MKTFRANATIASNNLQWIEAVAILTSDFIGTLPTGLAITLVPGALMGMVGAFLSSTKIAISSSSSLRSRSCSSLLSQEEKQQEHGKTFQNEQRQF
jgi:hypothetical protein